MRESERVRERQRVRERVCVGGGRSGSYCFALLCNE